MDPFHLTEDAIFDLDAIWLYQLDKNGLNGADETVTNLFKVFYRLARLPNIGHRRPDLTSRPVLFYKVFSYLIIYATGVGPLGILGVLHGKRDVAHILRRRQ